MWATEIICLFVITIRHSAGKIITEEITELKDRKQGFN